MAAHTGRPTPETRPKGWGPMSQAFPHLHKPTSPFTLKLVPTTKVPLKPEVDQGRDFANYIGTPGKLRTDPVLGYYYLSYPDYCKTTDSPYSSHTFSHLISVANKLDILEWNGVVDYPFTLQIHDGIQSPRLGGVEGKDFKYYEGTLADSKCVPIPVDVYDSVLEYLGELSPYEDSGSYMYQLNMGLVKYECDSLMSGCSYSDTVLETVLANEFQDYLQEVWGGNKGDGPFWFEGVDTIGYPATTKHDEEVLEQILGPPVRLGQGTPLQEPQLFPQELIYEEDIDPNDTLPWDYEDEIDRLSAHIATSSSPATSTGGGGESFTSDEYNYECWLQNHTSKGPRPTLFKKEMMIGGMEYTRLLKRKLEVAIHSVKTVLSSEELNKHMNVFGQCHLLKDFIYYDTVSAVEANGETVTHKIILDALCFLSDLDPAGWYSNESPALFMADPRPPTVDQLLTQYYATCAERRVQQGILQPRIISNKLYAKAMNLRMHNTSIKSEYMSSLTRAMEPQNNQVTSSGRLKKCGKNIYRINDVTVFERISYEYDNTIEITGDCIGYSHKHGKPFNVYPMVGAPLYSALRKGEMGLVRKIPKTARVTEQVEDDVFRVSVVAVNLADATIKRRKARQLLAAKQEQWANATLLCQQVRSVSGQEEKQAKRRSVGVEEQTQAMMVYPERATELKDMGIEPVATASSKAANDSNVSMSKILSQSLHSKLTSLPRKVVAKVKDKIESLDREKEVIGAVMNDYIRRQSMQDMITDANSKSMEDIMQDSTIVFAPSSEHSGLLLPKEVLMSDDQVTIVKSDRGEFRIATG